MCAVKAENKALAGRGMTVVTAGPNAQGAASSPEQTIEYEIKTINDTEMPRKVNESMDSISKTVIKKGKDKDLSLKSAELKLDTGSGNNNDDGNNGRRGYGGDSNNDDSSDYDESDNTLNYFNGDEQFPGYKLASLYVL